MRKRLCKKKHLGEFMEYGVHFVIRFDRGRQDFDTFLDAFILEAIEANRCYAAAGGRGDGDLLSGFIELGDDKENVLGRLAAINAWVRAQPDVPANALSPLVDAWYGPEFGFDEKSFTLACVSRCGRNHGHHGQRRE